MLRILLYLSIFFVTFLIGVVFTVVNEPVLEAVDRTPLNAPAYNPGNIYLAPTAEKSEKPECSDVVSAQILKRMLQIPQIAKEFEVAEFRCYPHLKRSEVDLNGDGRKEHIVRLWVGKMCGSKGNCPTAVFSETAKGFKEIYYHPGKLRIEALKKKTRGYRDIESDFHLGVYGQYVELLRFDGKRYRRVKCLHRQPDDTVEKVACWDEG